MCVKIFNTQIKCILTKKYVKFDEDNDLGKGYQLFQYIHFILDYLNQILYGKQIVLTLHVIFVMKEKYLSFFGVCHVLKPFGQTFCSVIRKFKLQLQFPDQ